MSSSPRQLKNLSQAIAVLGGKGGVGKTVTCVSLATLLSHLGADVGARILIIDADFATHGLSFFFQQQVVAHYTSRGHRSDSMLALAALDRGDLAAAVESFEPCHLGDRLDLIPSISDFAEMHPELRRGHPSDVRLARNVRRIITDLVRRFRETHRYIVIDCQAGAVPATLACIELSQIVMTITEADPVAVSSAAMIRKELNAARSDARREYFVINKLMPHQLGGLELVRRLLPLGLELKALPFDPRVHQSFYELSVPLDIDYPSAYVAGLCDHILELFPELHDQVTKFKADLDQRVAINLAQIRTREQELTRQLTREERRRRDARFFAKVVTVYVASALMMVGAVVAWRGSPDWGPALQTGLGVVLAVAVVVGGSLYLSLLVREEGWEGIGARLRGEDLAPATAITELRRELDDLVAHRQSIETMRRAAMPSGRTGADVLAVAATATTKQAR
jgi:MinD-like ATPase involved in chromosome partitioning or flagellar assembly